jgi:phosphoglucomutase
MAATAKDERETLYQWMVRMYREYGLYREGLVNMVRKGAEGAAQIRYMMDRFRTNPPRVIAGQKVVRVLDYLSGIDRNLLNGHEKKISQPKSDVLQFYTWEGAKISVRPSGTEPKIKFYVSVNLRLSNPENFELAMEHLGDKIKEIERDLVR